MVFVELAVVLALTLLNGALAMSELALVSARKGRLRSTADAGSRGAAAALRLIEDPGRFLSTVQIGITMVGILAGAFSGATLADRLGDWLDTWPGLAPHGDTIGIAVVVVAITYLSLILGELVPKRIALHNPEAVAARVAPAMQRIAQLASPAVWLLKISTEAALRLVRLHDSPAATISEEEIRAMIAEGTQIGVFVPKEREMIDGVLRLADRSVRAVMTPRREVAWLPEDAGREEIAGLLAAKRFSRFPVCRGGIDQPVGIVHTKDLLRMALALQPVDLHACMLPPLVVPDRTPVLKLLELFRRERIHLAIVVDEYGTVQGIASPTDVLEAIAGDLPERDEPEEPGAIQRADGSWLVDGSMAIDAFGDRVGLRDLRSGTSYQTVAGFMLHRLRHLPEAGEVLEVDGARFEVVDMDGRRIDKILYVPAQEAAAGIRAEE